MTMQCLVKQIFILSFYLFTESVCHNTAWAMGSHTGHTVIAIRDPEDDKLYIAESTENSSYWPTNGIQRTEYRQWMKQAKEAGYNLVWEPLSDEMREKFDVSAALEFFESVEGILCIQSVFAMLLSMFTTK